MPQVQGAGTVYSVGPGTNLRGPLALKRWPCAANGSTIDYVPLFDSDGKLQLISAGAQPILSGNVDPQLMQYKKVAITAAQWKALNGTPQSLIAAPGAGKYIALLDGTINFTFGAAQYANGSGVQVKVGTIVVATTTAALVNAVAANASLQLVFPGMGTAQTNGPDNTALTLTLAGAEFITGDSTANVHLWYAIVTG